MVAVAITGVLLAVQFIIFLKVQSITTSTMLLLSAMSFYFCMLHSTMVGK
jgi:hypothetical protein